MSKREVWKIRLKPDGTWENIYKDEFYEMDPMALAEMYMHKNRSVDRFALEESNRLEGMRELLIEDALKIRGMKEAEEVIERIKRLND
jgi:hypothetical protein